jgi:predicted RNA-binding protein YlxR (DUF448 family)
MSKPKTITELPILEKHIERAIKEWLQVYKWFVYKNHQSLGTKKGISDLTATKDGRTLWLEVKKEGGKQSQDQKDFERDIKAVGSEYYVVRSIEDVETVIALQGCQEAF